MYINHQHVCGYGIINIALGKVVQDMSWWCFVSFGGSLRDRESTSDQMDEGKEIEVWEDQVEEA